MNHQGGLPNWRYRKTAKSLLEAVFHFSRIIFGTMMQMSHKKFFWTEGIVLLYTVLPIISIMMGIVLSFILGCGVVNEGSVPDCLGGGLVYVLLTLGWLAIVTLPTGSVVLGIVLVWHVVWLLVRKK